MTAKLPDAITRLASRTGPRAAAFDADGVLWRGDVSEDFTRWMIERGHFDGALWPGYTAANDRDPAAGCLAILAFYRGHAVADLRAHVAEFWRTAPGRRWQPTVIAALRLLAGAGFRTFVVSGTPRIVLEPLPQHLPVAPADVLALDLEVDADGRCTGRPTGTVTTGPGKAIRLRAAAPPPVLLAAGNSVLDVELLREASDVRWVIEPDAALRAQAERERWTILENDHG
ncbi:MAG: HAD family hydrolase [Planctomycetota bacterium]